MPLPPDYHDLLAGQANPYQPLILIGNSTPTLFTIHTPRNITKNPMSMWARAKINHSGKFPTSPAPLLILPFVRWRQAKKGAFQS